MKHFVEIFGKDLSEELVSKLHVEEDNKDNENTYLNFFIEDDGKVLASNKVILNELKDYFTVDANQKDITNVINDTIKNLEKQLKQTQKPVISEKLNEVIIYLGTQVYGDKATKTKIQTFENDFWFKRLRDLLQNKEAKTRKQFMRLATYWYVLIEYEGYTESQVIDVLSKNKDKMKNIAEQWNVKNLSDFIERIHYIASTKQIEYFINLVKESSASTPVKNEIINKLLNSNILDTWDMKEEEY